MSTQIDLFRPFMTSGARHAAFDVMTETPDGRLFIGQGKRVDEFEQQLAEYLKTPAVLTVNSGTSALDLAFHLVGLAGHQRGRDVVITTPMTCSATNSPIATKNGRIMWADVDPITGNIDPASVGRLIRKCWTELRTLPAAVVAVDWGGRLCDYVELRRVIRETLDADKLTKGTRVPIIQDAAHAFGATYLGQPFLNTPNRGTYTCFSFQAIKHLTTIDGGALVCMDPSETDRARLLRWYGLDRTSGDSFRCSQEIDEVGYKYHMNDVAAAIGSFNLMQIPTIIAKHRANAYRYDGLLRNVPGVRLAPFDGGSSYWLYTVLVDDQPGFIQYMTERGIGVSQVHRRNDEHPAFQVIEIEPGPTTCPGLNQFAPSEVAIPVGWWVSESEIERVARTIVEWSISTHEPTYADAAQSAVASNLTLEVPETATESPVTVSTGLASQTSEQRRATLIRAGMMIQQSTPGDAFSTAVSPEVE